MNLEYWNYKKQSLNISMKNLVSYIYSSRGQSMVIKTKQSNRIVLIFILRENVWLTHSHFISNTQTKYILWRYQTIKCNNFWLKSRCKICWFRKFFFPIRFRLSKDERVYEFRIILIYATGMFLRFKFWSKGI